MDADENGGLDGLRVDFGAAQRGGAMARADKPHGGRAKGNRTWTPKEAKVLLQVAHQLHLDDNVGDSDSRWKQLSADVVTNGDPAWTERAPHTNRDHLVDMVKHTRSVANSFSIFAASKVNTSDEPLFLKLSFVLPFVSGVTKR